MASELASELACLREQHNEGLLDADQYKKAADAVVERFTASQKKAAGIAPAHVATKTQPGAGHAARFTPYGGAPASGKGAGKLVPAGGASGSAEIKQGDWMCPSCGNHNFARRALCHNCMAARPPEAGPAVGSQLRPGALATGGQIVGPEHQEAVTAIHQYQRACPENREHWRTYCHKHAEDKCDPKWHSAEFLWTALEELQGGSSGGGGAWGGGGGGSWGAAGGGWDAGTVVVLQGGWGGEQWGGAAGGGWAEPAYGKGGKSGAGKGVAAAGTAKGGKKGAKGGKAGSKDADSMEMRPGDWRCPQCDKHCFARRTMCQSCMAPRPPEAGEAVGSKLLPGALETGGAVLGPAHQAVIDELKGHLRNTEGVKDVWAQYCEQHAEGKRDPKWHSPEFLRNFLNEHIQWVDSSGGDGGGGGGVW